MLSTEEIKERIQKEIPDARVEAATDDRVHYQVEVVSDAFSGKSMVEQHQMVYRALGDAMEEAIHALGLKTSTPEEKTKQKGEPK